MKRRIRPLASVLLAMGAAWFWALLAAGQQAEDTTAESPIAGSWYAESMSMVQADGKYKTLSGADQRVSVIIAEKKFTMRVGGKILADMIYTLDTKPSPWTIDLKSPDGAMLGICTRTGDELKIALNDEAKGQPANFDRQSSGMLVDLKRQRRVQLSVINADGTGLHKVVAMPDFTRLGSPDWSRDGKKIAFDGWQEAYGANLDEAHVFVVNADGGGLKDLGPGCMPSWSPDDKQLTYGQYKEGYGVWIMNADGSNRYVLDGSAWGSQWSPVRNEIAIGRDRNLYIHDVATGKSRAPVEQEVPLHLVWGLLVAGRQVDLLPGRPARRRQGIWGGLDRGRGKRLQGAPAELDARHHD